MEEKHLTDKQREALKDTVGMAAGYERYQDRSSLFDKQDSEASSSSQSKDDSYGIASGYQKMNS